MTNAERIRSMNDEELANFLVEGASRWDWCDPSAPVDYDKNCWGKGREDSCDKCCKVWLQKEYDENTDISLDVYLSEESIAQLNPCHHCGKKPKKFVWSTGCLSLRCECGKHASQVNYPEDENNLAGLFKDLKTLWNGEVVKNDDD